MLEFCFWFFAMLAITIVVIIGVVITFMCLNKIQASTLVVALMMGIPIFLLSLMFMCTLGFFLYR